KIPTLYRDFFSEIFKTMKEVKITSVVKVFDSVEELPADVQVLMTQATEAREKAYSPYSNFKVGVALLLDNGEVVTENHQENAAYPSGLCAERVAVFHAGANFPQNKILKIAITARSEKQTVSEPIPPCGACRQSIAEYEIKQKQPIEIYFMGEKGKIAKTDS